MAEDMSQFNENSIAQKVANAQTQDAQQGSKDNPNSNEQMQLASMISDLDRRLRVLEERYSNLRKKIQLTDHNIIESEKSFGKELRNFNEDILKLKRNTNEFDEKIVIFDNEMQNVAQKNDLKVLEKYLAMWDPSMFVTRKELREYLKNKKLLNTNHNSNNE
jgi:predicted  nucleic acid-binding Zn-ribbon protein